VGCNILLGALPAPARLPAVADGKPRPTEQLRRTWTRFSWLAEQNVESRGWTADVLWCVEQLDRREFRLADVYAFEGHLGKLHPDNRHVRAKIRQQLQMLRDRGILRFLGRGRYEML
jgi:type II restriction enzyme